MLVIAKEEEENEEDKERGEGGTVAKGGVIIICDPPYPLPPPPSPSLSFPPHHALSYAKAPLSCAMIVHTQLLCPTPSLTHPNSCPTLSMPVFVLFIR